MNGFLFIDKESGYTSAEVVEQVNSLIKVKCGHAGTLDPLATGLLVIGVGRSTKLLDLLSGLVKTYEFIVHFGIETDTLDSEGTITKKSPTEFNESDLLSAMKEFSGLISQMVPSYSAQRVNGVRLYELARNNIQVALPVKKVTIYEFKLIKFDLPHIKFEVTCSKGTYVRALARDLSRKLNTVGHISYIRRTMIGPFRVEDAVKQSSMTRETIESKLIKPDLALGFLPSLDISEQAYEWFKNGRQISCNTQSDMARVYCNGNFVGISQRIDSNLIRPYKLLFNEG